MDTRFLEVFYCIYFNCNQSVEEVYKTARERMINTDPKAKIPSIKQIKDHVAKTAAKANAVAAETEAAKAAAPANESEAAK